MKIYMNGTLQEVTGRTVRDCFDSNTVVIVDGFAVDAAYELTQGQKVIAIQKGVMPQRDVLQAMLVARNGEALQSRLREATVAVIGLGGLGSQIAVMLARAGVGKIVVVDYDTVEPSNLNRQHYFLQNLGQKKTSAIRDIIGSVNPYVEVEAIDRKMDACNVCETVKDCSIICEAVDEANAKAEIVGALLEWRPDAYVVASSGMAGLHSGNLILTRKKMKNLYVCGDLVHEARVGQGLYSARVALCASHQANMVLRLIAGDTEV